MADKDELGKLCFEYKQEYDARLAALPKRWDSKRKIFTQQKPKEGFLAKAVREAFPDLAGKNNGDPEFQRAKQLAMRALTDYEKQLRDPTQAAEQKPRKKQYRQPGAGRKAATPEVRQAVFDWYVNKVLYFLLTREHIGTGTPRISVCRQDGPGPCYQNNAMSYSHIESISVLKCVHEERENGVEHGRWCPLIVMKTHAEIGCFETSVKINTLSLAPNRVIRETELGPPAH